MAPPPPSGLPLGFAPAVKGGKRPRAFGRTSNIWQYIEIVQTRSTPVAKYRKDSLSEQDDDDDDDDDEFGAAPTRLRGDALHPTAATSEPRKPSGGHLEPVHATATSHRDSTVDHRPSQVAKHGRGLPELNPPSAVGKRASAAFLYASVSPTNANGGRKSVTFNSGDVIKRIHALGTSSSAPVLTAPAAAMAPPTVLSPAATAGQNNNAPPLGAAASTTTPLLSEAERLRNDFNSQRGKLYYGCSVAFELFNGHLMMVNSPDGAVGIQALEKMQLKSANNASGRHRAVFTLIDLSDVRSASSIRYGDAVWLQLSVGTGESSWEQGGVLGAKVREAPQLKALALADDESIRNDAQAPLIVGYPMPVRAYLPKNRDDMDAQVDEIQSRVRNKSSKMLGKWIVRSAVQRHRPSTDNFVYNTDEIFLEQDWFYLGADSDAGVAVLRQLPPASAVKEIKLGEYVVERRGAWRIRLLDSSNGSGGLSLAQQQMEKLLLRAKTQLKQSRKMRAGQTKQYGRQLSGGAAFVTQLRSQLAEITRDCDSQYMAMQERRLSALPQHLSSVANTLESPNEPGGGCAADERPPQLATVSPGRSLSVASTRAGSAASTNRTRDLSGDGGGGDAVCSLCQSSSIRYNLCCQIHHVMATLHSEVEQASAARAAAKVSAQSPRHIAIHTVTPPPTASLNSGADRVLNHKQRCPSIAAAPAAPTLTPSASAPVLAGSSGDQSRLFQLFTQQDEQLQDVIKFKEKAVEATQVAAMQARVGLSPVATQFRDRFKHVTSLAQQHEQDVTSDDHGIGGHFHKLHAELKRDETQRRESHQRGKHANRAQKYLENLLKAQAVERARMSEDAEEEDDDGELLVVDTTTTCPLELPGHGFDVYGNPVAPQLLGERLFPNEDEMDTLPPVDTKQALELYLQNKSAVVEMLDGFVELTVTHILPNLSNAMESRNRGALVEFLDFAARASEFVCARRVQVRVAQLLHEISACDVGDFESFMGSYDTLLQELDNTSAFIRFYRDKMATKQKKKRTPHERLHL